MLNPLTLLLIGSAADVNGLTNNKGDLEMDNKARRRKIYKTEEAKNFDKGNKNSMQDNLDKLGYETPKENASADDYVKSLGW